MALTYAQIIAETHYEILRDNPKALILGVGANDGGKFIFNTTRKAAEAYPDRVIETPLSETMLTGAICGMAADGMFPTLIHARADFLYLSGEHLLNTAATFRMIHGKPCPITVRAIIGRGWGNGPMHTKAPLGMFNVDGLSLFTPASREGIRKALTNAIRTGIPTVVMEERRLYDRVPPETQAQAVDWFIPPGPAPASKKLEDAYYGYEDAPERSEAF